MESQIRKLLRAKADEVAGFSPALPGVTMGRVRRRRLITGIGSTVALTLVILGAVVGASALLDREDRKPVAPKTVEEIALPARPVDVVMAFGRTWIFAGNEVLVFEPGATVPVARITLDRPDYPDEPRALRRLAAGEGAVWALIEGDQAVTPDIGDERLLAFTLVRIDPNTAGVTASRTIHGTVPKDLAVGEGAVWVLGGTHVNRLSPLTLEPEAKIELPTNGYEALVAEGAVWIVGQGGVTSLGQPLDFVRVDTRTNHATALTTVDWGPKGLATTSGAIWVGRTDHQNNANLRDDEDEVLRLDPGTGEVLATVEVPARARRLGSGAGFVWLALERDRDVAWIDPATNSIVDSVELPGLGKDTVAGDGYLWVTPFSNLSVIWRIAI